MKIALIILPPDEGVVAVPPLPLAYLAAVLEQERHFVRIYDLAVRGSGPHANIVDSVRSYRPSMALICGEDGVELDALAAKLDEHIKTIVRVNLDMRCWQPTAAVLDAMRAPDQGAAQGAARRDEQSVILRAVVSFDAGFDSLPFPARHLLALEQYRQFNVAGQAQTPIVVGRSSGERTLYSSPSLIIAEIRSVTQEQGYWHFLFEDIAINENPSWLRALVQQLIGAQLPIFWEARVAYHRLTPELVALCKRGGCEGLTFSFDAMVVLENHDERLALAAAVRLVRECGLAARGRIALEPHYSTLPALVDMSATFGLDDASFEIRQPATAQLVSNSERGLAEFATTASADYLDRRGRQYYVTRFGEHLGPMIWRLGKRGILGRELQRYAAGGDTVAT